MEYANHEHVSGIVSAAKALGWCGKITTSRFSDGTWRSTVNVGFPPLKIVDIEKREVVANAIYDGLGVTLEFSSEEDSDDVRILPFLMYQDDEVPDDEADRHPHCSSDGHFCTNGGFHEEILAWIKQGHYQVALQCAMTTAMQFNPRDRYHMPPGYGCSCNSGLQAWGTCGPCGSEVCDDCGYYCTNCDYEVCSDCSLYCENCDQHFCGDCTVYCEYCNRTYCTRCADMQVCEGCNNSMCEMCRDSGRAYPCAECGVMYCDDCLDDLEECADCGDVMCKKHDSASCDCGERHFCRSCARDSYNQCADCGTLLSGCCREYGDDNRGHEQFLCESCKARREEDEVDGQEEEQEGNLEQVGTTGGGG